VKYNYQLSNLKINLSTGLIPIRSEAKKSPTSSGIKNGNPNMYFKNLPISELSFLKKVDNLRS